ncbi:MAG: leucyl/phenylalanyl-tRNA--protein transferase [Bdellovibrionota bacterium]
MNTRKPISTGPVKFPDPWTLPEESDGLIYIGGNLNSETLLQAYSLGIFPWPLEEAYPLFWFCPEPRGVLDFNDLHVPKSLAKLRKKGTYRVTFNQAFRRVMEECAKQPRPGQEGTWIVPALLPAYEEFHAQGYAHSVEIWRGDALVGGLYGVSVKGVFSGESMFHLEPNTSKIALIEMAEKLRSLGLKWMDIQMLTPVTEAVGGHYVSRRDFLKRLKEEHAKSPPAKLRIT